MKRFFLIIFGIIFVISILTCNKKESSPTQSSEPPTPVPVNSYNVSVELHLPVNAQGKNYSITFDTDLYSSNGFYLKLTGTCDSSLSVTRTVKVNQGNYFITGFVDNDDDGFMTTYDLIGIYNGTIPDSVPANPNASINADSYFYVTMTTISGSNLSGTIVFPKDLNDSYDFYVFCDSDLNTANGIENIYWATLPDGITYSAYSMFIPFTGMYYLYGFVDFSRNYLPPDPYDFFGYYNFKQPQPLLTPPVSPNTQILSDTDNYINFPLASVPTPTNTPTNPPIIPTNTVTFTPTCGADIYEDDGNTFNAYFQNIEVYPVSAIPTVTHQKSIYPADDIDFVKLVISNTGDNAATFDVHIKTEPGDINGDTELSVYDSSNQLIAYDDNSGTDNYSYLIIPDVTINPHTYDNTFFIKINEKGQDANICQYDLKIWLTPK